MSGEEFLLSLALLMIMIPFGFWIGWTIGGLLFG